MNFAALDLIVDRSDCSSLQKSLLKRKLRKSVKRHGLEGFSPEWRYRYCCARLALGDYSDYSGWECRSEWAHELYWQETWLPKWGGGYVDRLLILGEQGIGDEVMYTSIIPEAMVRVKEVVYECDDRLHTLLERSLPGLKCESRKDFEDKRDGRFDAYIPASGLMRMFRRRGQDFPRRPFLKPKAERIAELGVHGGKTAVSWSGRQGSICPGTLKSAVAKNSVGQCRGNESSILESISVQYGSQVDEIEEPGIDLTNDIEGVVALCSVVDRVVTVPTSVMHFAGALGKPVDVIWPEKKGEIDNQIRWDHSPGPHPFYEGVYVYRSLDEWLHQKRRLAVACG